MKFVIIVALFAVAATAENAAQPNQRLWHIIGAIAGLLNPRPVVPGPAIVDKPIGDLIWNGPVIIDSPAGEGPVIADSPIWDGPVIVDTPVAEGPVIAEYPEFDSPISVGPVIIDEPVDTDAPILIPQPVFPFPITSPLVQVIVNIKSNPDIME